MKTLTAILFLILIIPLAGCDPAGKAITSLQYHNLDWHLSKSIMTITIGDGSVNMKREMQKETFVGRTCQGHVTVEYPEGLGTEARKLAQDFDQFYPIVKQKLGIEWDFDLVLRLVRVQPGASGYRYSVKLNSKRRLVFPVPVVYNSPEACWAPVIAHEMTEASMIAPCKRSQLVLADLWAGSFYISTGARWFRDGTADYASYLFAHRLPPASVYYQLNQVKGQLLDWANYDGSPDWYDAASGLIFEMTNRYGEDALPRLMCELSKEAVPGGDGLKRAFQRTTGANLEDFLCSYATPWIGAEVCQRGSAVLVSDVYPATPASRRGIEIGDEIICLGGTPISDVNHYTQVLARQRVWNIVPITIKRDNELLKMKVKLIPRPADPAEFLRLSGKDEKCPTGSM